MNAPMIAKAHEGELVSPDLAPLLLAVYDELAKRSADLRPLQGAIERLLTFLSSPRGRTSANCWATDLFFALGEGWGRRQLGACSRSAERYPWRHGERLARHCSDARDGCELRMHTRTAPHAAALVHDLEGCRLTSA